MPPAVADTKAAPECEAAPGKVGDAALQIRANGARADARPPSAAKEAPSAPDHPSISMADAPSRSEVGAKPEEPRTESPASAMLRAASLAAAGAAAEAEAAADAAADAARWDPGAWVASAAKILLVYGAPVPPPPEPAA